MAYPTVCSIVGGLYLRNFVAFFFLDNVHPLCTSLHPLDMYMLSYAHAKLQLSAQSALM